jgi:hypothetical protein
MNVIAHAGIEMVGEVGFYGITCLTGRCLHDRHRLRSRTVQWVLLAIFTLVTAPITVTLVG